MDGIALQEELAARGVKVAIIFLSAHADVPTSVRAVKAGAVDFLLKPFVPEQFLAAVRGALERSELMMREGRKLEGLRARYSALTQREREVLGLVVRGQLNKEIASELGAAEKTVEVGRAGDAEDGSRVACRARTAGRGTRAPFAGVANRVRWGAGARRGPAVGGWLSIEREVSRIHAGLARKSSARQCTGVHASARQDG